MAGRTAAPQQTDCRRLSGWETESPVFRAMSAPLVNPYKGVPSPAAAGPLGRSAELPAWAVCRLRLQGTVTLCLGPGGRPAVGRESKDPPRRKGMIRFHEATARPDPPRPLDPMKSTVRG